MVSEAKQREGDEEETYILGFGSEARGQTVGGNSNLCNDQNRNDFQ
jgi:hypothetical protein